MNVFFNYNRFVPVLLCKLPGAAAVNPKGRSFLVYGYRYKEAQTDPYKQKRFPDGKRFVILIHFLVFLHSLVQRRLFHTDLTHSLRRGNLASFPFPIRPINLSGTKTCCMVERRSMYRFIVKRDTSPNAGVACLGIESWFSSHKERAL